MKIFGSGTSPNLIRVRCHHMPAVAEFNRSILKPQLLRLNQIELAKSRERLVDQEERLERRKKANSRKNEELKRKEEELEAVRWVVKVTLVCSLSLGWWRLNAER